MSGVRELESLTDQEFRKASDALAEELLINFFESHSEEEVVERLKGFL